MSQISLQENDTKLDGIEANANNYSHPTGAGNNHIPTGGAVGQILENTASGEVQWADATGSIFPAFSNSTWTTASFSGSTSQTRTFTAPTGGNGVFLIGRVTVRSNNTSVNGSFYNSISGTGSYVMIGGAYGGYNTAGGGGTGFGGAIAGNPIQHGVWGFIAPGGTWSIAGSNLYTDPNCKYKTV